MPWSTTRPASTKYRTREHRALSAAYKTAIRSGQALVCTARECVMPSRVITNPNGRAPDGVSVGHADNGIDYDGPQHLDCNVRDGAARGRSRRGQSGRWVV